MTHNEMINALVAKFKISRNAAYDAMIALVGGDDLDEDTHEIFFEYYCNNGEMPYGTAKATTGDPYVWIVETVGKELGIQ